MAVALGWIGGLVGAPMLAGGDGSVGGAGAALVALIGAMAVVVVAPVARDALPRALVVAAVVSSAIAAGLSAGGVPARSVEVPEGVCRVTADVVEVRHDRRGASSTVRVVDGARIDDGASVPRDATLRVRAKLPRGARVRALLRVRPYVEYRNPTPHPQWPIARPGWLGRWCSAMAARCGKTTATRCEEPGSRTCSR